MTRLDDIMTSLLKKLSVSIKIRVVTKLLTESVGSRRELVVNCVHTADTTLTPYLSRVGDVYWA